MATDRLCYNKKMEVGDVRYYKDRWQAVEEIEWEEMRALTLEERWQKINTILRFAMESGMKLEADEGEMDVFMRWAKIKAKYNAG